VPVAGDGLVALGGFRAALGDTGFTGAGMITPIRKPRTRDLMDWEKEFNTQVAKFRWVIEQIIANFKT
jgi:hypothetical protein